ncbi:MAG: hypothetical protein HG453_001130 [Clostridiales bacterium]|nr:hypothetical protein [Clostridiales bacterium]
MKLLILIAFFVSIFSVSDAQSISSYNCTYEEQQEALAEYHSFVSGFDDGLYNYTNIYYSDDNYKMGYRLGSAHRR